jgi:callose synthase
LSGGLKLWPFLISHISHFCHVNFSTTLYRNQRFFSGLVSGLFSGFLTYTYLEPLFVPVGSETAMVFLYILVIHAALVGMGLGVLLPMLFAGVCFGGAAALLVGTVLVLEYPWYFPMFGAVAAVLGAILSAR